MEARHISAEYTDKGMPHINQLAKLGFADVTGKAIDMMVQANLPDEIMYKLCKKFFSCAKYISSLAVVTLERKIEKQQPGTSIFMRQNHVMPRT